MTDKLDWREIAALRTFENRKIVHLNELPSYIGLGIMGSLVGKGLVEPVDRSVPLYSKDFGWKLTRTISEE